MAVKFTYSFCHQCTVNGTYITVQTVTVRLVNLAENKNVSSSLFSASLSECDLNVCILLT
jgi:hypothetical protein